MQLDGRLIADVPCNRQLETLACIPEVLVQRQNDLPANSNSAGNRVGGEVFNLIPVRFSSHRPCFVGFVAVHGGRVGPC